jgi:hypothetical protein
MAKRDRAALLDFVSIGLLAVVGAEGETQNYPRISPTLAAFCILLGISHIWCLYTVCTPYTLSTPLCPSCDRHSGPLINCHIQPQLNRKAICSMNCTLD